MAYAGGCLCGVVLYQLLVEALPPVYACHCLDCQTVSGSACALNAIIPAATLAIVGSLTRYDRGTCEHPASVHYLCDVCHTRLYSEHPARPGQALLRAGTLNDSQAIVPIAHIWTRHRHAWITLPPDIPTWPESPPPPEFAAALHR